MKWSQIKQLAVTEYKNRKLPKEYFERLKFEIKEIEKQGFEARWEEKFDTIEKVSNKNGLVLTWLIGKSDIDPIATDVAHSVYYSAEWPDIDVDFVPEARNIINEYAAEHYGHDKVCRVGAWQTFKPKLAIQDAARALGVGSAESRELTKNLPDEFDDLEKEIALKDYEQFAEFYKNFPEVVDLAYRMVSRIKTQGKHAGGIIISSVPLIDHIPLTMSSSADRELGRWASSWTEGRNLQLSKFGFIKFDLLGVRTIGWQHECRKRIEINHGIKIDWSDMSPENNRAGWIEYPDGTRKAIPFDDPQSLKIANNCQMETIFQFETDLATSIIAKGGVKSFNDLVAYTSLGRPGPLPMVDVYIARRDGEEWKSTTDPKIVDMLSDTYGIIVFQEQLATMWRTFAGFTAPDAEKARKAVAKKWEDQLKPIEMKWIEGASKTIGLTEAREWWDKMVTFGRYAFNKSHAAAYTVITYRCLWFKAHFLPEWWASVLSDPPHRDKLVRWMGIARLEGVKFGTLDVNKLSVEYTVHKDRILPGLSMVKGIGANMAKSIVVAGEPIKDIHDYIKRFGSSKTIIERLVKLGAFDKLHASRKALWLWWQCKYGKDEECRELKRHVQWSLAWDKAKIEQIRKTRIDAYFAEFPGRKKVPVKLATWIPTKPDTQGGADYGIGFKDGIPVDKKHPEFVLCSKIEFSLEDIERLCTESYTLQEILRFEKEYLGFFWHSPMDVFDVKGHTIAKAKKAGMAESIIECVVEKVEFKQGPKSEFAVLSVTDGIEHVKVMLWGAELEASTKKYLVENVGVRMRVLWNEKFRSFNIARGAVVLPLRQAQNAT